MKVHPRRIAGARAVAVALTLLLLGAASAWLFAVRRGTADVPQVPPDAPPTPPVEIALANRTLKASGFPATFCEHQKASVRGTAAYVVALTNGASKLEALTTVRACGARVIGPLPPNAFLVETSVFALGKMSVAGPFSAASEWLPEDKLDARLKPMLSAGPDTLEVTLVALASDDVERLVARVAELGGARLAGCLNGKTSVTLRLPRTALAELVARGDVRWIEPFQRPKPLNDVAVGPTTMNVRTVWDAHGLTGANQLITTSDSGIDTGDLATMHRDLRDRIAGLRVVEGCYATDLSGHGTHTAGSIVGDGTESQGRVRGVAFGAKLWAWFCQGQDGYIHTPGSCAELFRPEGATNAFIHSASWGIDYYGAYDESCRSMDGYVWDHPDFLPVVANGNAGTLSKRMGSPATAKNVLSVGATQNARTGGDGGYGNGDPTKTAAYSSRGPCADGRIKPDLAAPGTGVASTRAYGISYSYGECANVNYAYESGTSMATPLTAGAAALVRQWLVERRGFTNAPPTAALVKAILTGGARGRMSPDNEQGWGRVDLGESLYPSNRAVRLVDRIPFVEGYVCACRVTLTNDAPFDAQLVWIDYPATAGAKAALVNDLDLVVSNHTTGAVLYGNGVTGGDRTNTLEGVRIARAAKGDYSVLVRCPGITYDSTLGGAAALYLRGAFAETNAEAAVTLALTAAVPAAATLTAKVGSTNDFAVTVVASNGLSVAYSWTVDGVAVPGAATNRFAYVPSWTDRGSRVVKVVASAEGGRTVSRSWVVSVLGDVAVDAATGDDATATGEAARPFATISAALAHAFADETVLVGPGTYDGGLVVPVDVACLASREGPASTVIDGGGSNRCVDCYYNMDAVLSGLTLTNGWLRGMRNAAECGAGSYGGVLTNCVIADCTVEAYGYGGGAYGAVLTDCIIRNCVAASGGGGAFRAVLSGCVVSDCSADVGGGVCKSELTGCVVAGCTSVGPGGAAYASSLVNCTVRGNRANETYNAYSPRAGGGVDCQCVCTNTALWGNVGPSGGEDNWESYVHYQRITPWSMMLATNAPSLSWCCTRPLGESGANSFTNDPQFVTNAVADARVYETSPCIGTGCGGANVGAYAGKGVPRVLPKLPSNPTGAQVSNAVASVGYADKGVVAGIGTNAATYAQFSAWSTNGLSSKAVVLSTRAFDSFRVRELVAAPTLLAEGAKSEIELSALVPATDGTCSTVVSLVDGDRLVPLAAVRSAFAARTRLGIEPTALAPADPSQVAAEMAADAVSVKLTITPPALTSRYFMRFDVR